MKAQTEPIGFLLTIVMGFIITFLGIALLLFFLNSVDIKREIAFASTEKLAGAINEACFLGKDQEVKIDFTLPQRKPLKDIMKVVEFNLPAAFRIKEDGDPQYVVYYQMFPPGEGVGWEVYHDFGNRAIKMISGGQSLSYLDFKHEFDQMRTDVSRKTTKSIDNYMIANVKLDPQVDLTSGITDLVPPNERDKKGWGEWQFIGEGNRKVFKFNGYSMLNDANMTAIKYASCGKGNLCLKTTEGVYAFPLDKCSDYNIEYIEMLNPDRDGIEFGLTGLSAPLSQAGRGNSFRMTNFNLASPCDAQLKVKLTDCTNREGPDYDPTGIFPGWGSDFIDTISPGNPSDVLKDKCDNMIRVPLYERSGTNFVINGYHKVCLEDIDNNGDVDHHPAGNVLQGDTNCIRIEFEEKNDYCFVKNLDKSIFEKIEVDIVPAGRGAVPIVTAGAFFWTRPVTESTAFYDNNIFVMKNMDVPGGSVGVFNQIKQFFGFQQEWWWP